MRITIVLLLGLVGAACTTVEPRTEEAPHAPASAAPESSSPLEDAFQRLDRELPPADRAVLRQTHPDTLVRYHFSLGMYIRNEYGLWRGGALSEYFRAKGVAHPEDMSHILLQAYGFYLRGQRPPVDSLIAVLPPPPVSKGFVELPPPSP